MCILSKISKSKIKVSLEGLDKNDDIQNLYDVSILAFLGLKHYFKYFQGAEFWDTQHIWKL